ncbi:MAG: putative sporulation protein YtxC [Clostridia bacterium]|nr:putative sporulation protein YtxC [Clostridia bacterium]
MKSICIKTNSTNSIQYLLNELNQMDLDHTCFSIRDFKHFKNIIIHYTGKDYDLFLQKLSNILSFLVIDELEESLLNKLIFRNYFYFDLLERKEILNLCYDINANDFSYIFDEKLNSVQNCFYEYLLQKNSLVLDGFINFRLHDYMNILDKIVTESVNQFVVEKEYNEFISLLKLYINSQTNNCNLVHLIYLKNESILLDENKEIINISKDIFSAKYLSDISFSSNDFTLNSLLTLLPEKIYIHMIDCSIDEFITTLQSIFENRIHICTDCSICNLYNISNKSIDIKNLSIKSPNTF